MGTTMASRADFEGVMGLVLAGELDPVVDDVLSLDRNREAHERLESGRVFGKLVIVP